MAFRQVREVRQRKRYGGKIFTALLLIAALVAGMWYAFFRSPDIRTVHAEFPYVNGLYTGSKVTVLGVHTGQITAIEPQGTKVRVTMEMPGDVKLPENVEAFVLNPSVISDRHLDLGPAYTDGPELADGATIPLDRTHAPISWDQLMESVSTLTSLMGTGEEDGEAGLAPLLNTTAETWDGRGEDFSQALTALASATGIIGARTEDISSLIDSLHQLMVTFQSRQVSLDGLIRSMSALTDQWADSNPDLTTPLEDLRTVFNEINGFILHHGEDVGVVAENLEELGNTLVANQQGLAEFMDLAPLMMQNLSSTIGPDRRGRIRLNISTTLTQFETLKPLCDQFPLPICIGAGLTNPISFPISASDPLGIVSAISGGQLPPKAGN